PEAERKFLSGVGAQYESEVVYHQVREDLEKQGIVFMDMDSGLREHEDLVREYFATISPPNDNKLAALNSAVWSGGSFVYVPPGPRSSTRRRTRRRTSSPSRSRRTAAGPRIEVCWRSPRARTARVRRSSATRCCSTSTRALTRTRRSASARTTSTSATRRRCR